MTMELIKKIALISGSETGFRKELNLVSWNGKEPKYDLRNWSPEGIPLRGVTLTEDEAKELQKVLNDMFAEQTE
ncbi:MAG: hypothetical protein IJH43_05565 [Mogibacterium sp.]|nr:hypothetical protein [Mogibacterium sp.]